MFTKMLFATDFSAYAKKTLDCIAGFPGAREVTLFHVIEETRSPWGGGEIGDAIYSAEKERLREEKHSLESLNQDLRVTTAVESSSDIAGAIIRAAEERKIPLIVIGARGNSLVGGILLGSVSIAVMRRSRTSVLIMRHKIIEEMKAKTYEQFCPMILFNVLCPVDFSPHSDRAIACLAATTGVRSVLLLHVVSKGESEAEIGERREKAEREIGAIRSSLAARGIDARAIVRTGDPGSEIARIAEKEDVSVVWMSSHGTGWFRELLLGSTAHAVAMNALRPVLIIRSPEGGE